MKFLDKKFSIILIFLFIIICISIYFFTKEESSEFISTNELYISSNVEQSDEETHEIIIHIDGEIVNPGLVRLPTESRIADAITAAGGITELANISKINLAYELKDGQKIYIPSIYDEEITVYVTNDAGENVLITDPNHSSNLVNINSATSAELQSLSGVGESTANKIIQYREEHGSFKSIEEIMNVSGIGESKFKAIEDFICI